MHPSVIIRTSCIKELKLSYNEKHVACEDYGLWVNLSKTQRLCNIDQPLLLYRKSSNSITSIASKQVESRDKSHMEIYKEFFTSMNLNFTEIDLLIFRKFTSGTFFVNNLNFLSLIDILLRVKLKIRDDSSFDIVLRPTNYEEVSI